MSAKSGHDWQFDLEKGPTWSNGAITATLSHPDIFIDHDGAPCFAICSGVDHKIKESALEVTYRWSVSERVFIGVLALDRCGQTGVVGRLRVWSEDGQAWSMRESTEGSLHLLGWKDVCALQIFHADNIRGVSQEVSLMDGTYFIPFSQWKKLLNAGRWQAFPGLWIRDPKSNLGFVTGVLSQNAWEHTLSGQLGEANEVFLHGRMTPPGIDFRAFAAGEVYEGEELYFESVDATNPRDAFRGYLDALEQRITPTWKKSTLSRGPFWGSWNDRQPHFWDVDMELIERTAKVLSARFPTVRSIQIDDGYAFGGYHEVAADRWALIEEGFDPSEVGRKIQRVRRLGAGFAGEPDFAIARDRFPEGMEAAAAFIKNAGYQPAIWLGLDIVKDSAVISEHPEWFTACTAQAHGDPELLTVFGEDAVNRTYVLDPSMPEARAYIERALAVLFRDWKFESFKLDFWSYAFENDGFRLRIPSQTAFELRRWFLSTVRSYLPDDAYFVIACDISTGNPFFSEWVDAVRYGLDIGNGKWENFRYSAMTGTFLLNVGLNRFYLLDPDSVGLLRKLPESERQCFWAWSAVTRSLCEIAGDLAKASRAEIAPLQKLFLAPKNGAKVRLGEYGHLERGEPASIVFAPGDLFSSRGEADEGVPCGVLAVFNWSEEPRVMEVVGEHLGIDESCEILDMDFFASATQVPIRRKGRWEICLEPHSVRFSHLSYANARRVLDSDWAISDLHESKSGTQLKLHGDSPNGFLVFWPEKPQIEVASSNLDYVIDSLGDQIYRIRPHLGADELQCWEITLR